MDNHTEIRQSYLGGFSILVLESFFWLLAGILWNYISFKTGILVIIVSGTFFYPLSQLLQIILKRPKVRKENPLNLLFTQISLIIPFSFPLIFMLTKENVNLFFPALTVIIGAHYLPFVYAYKMNIYWILASLLVICGSIFGFVLPDNMSNCAYYTGGILFLFAILNYYLIKKEISAKYSSSLL